MTDGDDKVVSLLEECINRNLIPPTENYCNSCELLREDIECVHMWLDDQGAPRQDAQHTFSIIGRIQKLLEKR